MNRTNRMVTGWMASTLLGWVATVAAEPLDMRACIEYARQHSPQLAGLKIAHESQQLSTLIARAAFDVGLSVDNSHASDGGDGSVSATLSKRFAGDIDVAVGASLSYDEEDAESYSVKISKVILGGGSFRASRLGINNSLLDETINLNAANRYERELVYRVKEVYYRIIRDIQGLKIREMRLERSKRNLEHALVRERPLDIATAKIEVPENEAAVLQAKRSIESSYDELKRLIGMDVDESLEILTEFQYEKRAVDYRAGTESCLENDEEVLNARLSVKKSENDAHALGVETWPEVKVSGAANYADDGSGEMEDEFVATVSLSWDLGSRAERAAHRRALNTVRARDLDVRKLRLAKTKDIRDLARRLDESARLIDLQDKRVELGVRLAEIYRDRWENGEIDILEYVRSQNDLENSKIQLVNLKSSYMALLAQYQFTAVAGE